jgi:hypothetical protein
MTTKRKPTGKAIAPNDSAATRSSWGKEAMAPPSTAIAANPPRETSTPPITAVTNMSKGLRSSRSSPTPVARSSISLGFCLRMVAGSGSPEESAAVSGSVVMPPLLRQPGQRSQQRLR